MNNVMKVYEWKTLNYPEKRIGNAEIKVDKYNKGHYLMEGVKGNFFFEVMKTIPITNLMIDGKTVMVDDPLHWEGMKALAEKSRGKVIIAGLGLGILAHFLLKNEEVTQVDVVEINPNVIKLIEPILPKDERLNIIQADWFTEVWRKKKYDYIIFDLLVNDYAGLKIAGEEQQLPQMQLSIIIKRMEFNCPHSKIYVWGLRDKKYNPSVELSDEQLKRYIDAMESEFR